MKNFPLFPAKNMCMIKLYLSIYWNQRPTQLDASCAFTIILSELQVINILHANIHKRNYGIDNPINTHSL